MTTFVLVHGSFHGGWCWKKVEPLLREQGHEVYTPTMTGLGERSHLVHPRVGLELNVEDIVQVFEYEDLEDVVLLGHSYGSLVINGVAEHCHDRIRRLVYLDGFLPEHGKSAWDIAPEAEKIWEERAVGPDDWLVFPADPADVYDISDPDDLEWLRDNLVPTAHFTHREPLDIPDERAKDLPRSYIACTHYEPFQPMAEQAREEVLDYYELDTSHEPMVTNPDQLVQILLETAAP